MGFIDLRQTESEGEGSDQLQLIKFFIMLLPETLSVLSKNPIFIALNNAVTTYFILVQSLDLNIILP